MRFWHREDQHAGGKNVINKSDEITIFSRAFNDLTGSWPLSWQKRLFTEHFAPNKELCQVIDLPTGLGKTMVMAIWLIARMWNTALPRRLIYVVDRRTVVDQATDLAKTLVENWNQKKVFEAAPPVISTLRGQLADNREWSRDPSRHAIIIGTVDLIGSALLFSGYRSSYKRRPLEAGLLGQDSLLVLDEAHLSKPFEKLICKISGSQKRRDGQDQGKPMRVLRMSATSGESKENDKSFTLQFDAQRNLTGEDANDKTITERFSAKKRLTIATLGERQQLRDRLAEEAINLANNHSIRGKRIVVFVRKPEDATAIAGAIRGHVVETIDTSDPKPKKTKNIPYSESVEVLTGTMRGLERDELVERTVMKRFLDGNEDPESEDKKKPVFLVSTSAGQVGFDANGDHLAGDATTLDSWIQRLGRANRRGHGEAKIILVIENKPAEKSDFDKACNETSALFQKEIENSEFDDMVVSPKALATFKQSLTPEQIKAASSPAPATVELTDILLDAWSMTSIMDRMPGRPEVGPWLRGIDNEQAQTTVAWRAELELFSDDSSPEKALHDIFIKHSIRPHESLTVNTGYLLEFLKRIDRLKGRPADLISTRVAVRLPGGQVFSRTLQQLIDEPGILYVDSTLILPAKFGGLDRSGMLDAESISKVWNERDTKPQSLDVADQSGYEQREDAVPRIRVLIQRTDGGRWEPQSLPGGVAIAERLQLEEHYATSTLLFDALRKNGLRIRRVQPVGFSDDGDAVRSLIMLSPVANKDRPDDQSLDKHVRGVEIEAKRIADALHVAEDDPVRISLFFAARWHDEGKKADVWQRFVYGPDAEGYKGKSSQTRDPQSLRGYRHEFGSLLRIRHPHHENTTGFVLPEDHGARELALHLIATHHGGGRPHFGPGQYHPFNVTEVDAVHIDVIRRFARLQWKYGWWRLAWLENLLRCADALASADQDAEDDSVDVEGDAI